MPRKNSIPFSKVSFVKVPYFAVGILYFFIKDLAKSLLPSNWAPLASGPMTGILYKSSSFIKKSAIPSTRGCSGPTITISILFSITAFFTPSKSLGSMGKFLPCFRVPEFPGAINNSSKIELCAIFHAKACSLPPDPNNKIFISCVLILIQRNFYPLN